MAHGHARTGVQRSEGPVFTPDQVISVLLGSQSIVLNGFCEVDMRLAKQVPNVPLYLLGDSPAQEELIQQVDQGWKTKIKWLSALVLVLVLLAGLSVGWMINGSTGAPKAAEALVWKASRVQSDGVLIVVAGREILFPLGGMLPSGEELKRVDPLTQTYTTSEQVVTLNSKVPTK